VPGCATVTRSFPLRPRFGADSGNTAGQLQVH
jgi:hypothetical protein